MKHLSLLVPLTIAAGLGGLAVSALSGGSPVASAPGPEVREWKQVAIVPKPTARVAHAAAWDEARKVMVVFGGYGVLRRGEEHAKLQDIWEWEPVSGVWKNRTVPGIKPEPRAGASLVYDRDRSKFVLFGGKSGSPSYFDDIWEWDPTTGAWFDRTAAGSRPRGRSHHGAAYDSGRKKVLLFGGGMGDYEEVAGPMQSLGDTWEWDPATGLFADRKPAAAPTVRHSSAFAWDAKRGRAILFGGFSKLDSTGAVAILQDTWEWDGTAGTWTERTAAGTKPTGRYGAAAAFDAVRGKLLMISGYDINGGQNRRDFWEWDAMTGVWTERLETPMADRPPGKVGAGLVFDASSTAMRSRAFMFGGWNSEVLTIGGKEYPGYFTQEEWELDLASGKWVDRAGQRLTPPGRYQVAMAFDANTKATVAVGGRGRDSLLDDTWEWNGQKWTDRSPAAGLSRPSARWGAAMAYDPAGKRLILFGGDSETGIPSNETWAWNGGAGTWTRMAPALAPSNRFGAAMATDTARGKIFLFGGYNPNMPRPPRGSPPQSPYLFDLWEWDGAAGTWTDKTPPAGSQRPLGRYFSGMFFDEERRRLILTGGEPSQGSSSYWEWDPDTNAWTERMTAVPEFTYGFPVYYDGLRKRAVATGFSNGAGEKPQLWEFNGSASVPGLWSSAILTPSPYAAWYPGFVFDAERSQGVFFGGQLNGDMTDETWVFGTSNHADGTPCSAASAARCASGFCVDGVCCGVAACAGGCSACNVPGSAGKCAPVRPSAQAGTCSGAQACDGTGMCKAANGQACASGATCASGFCADGVCCGSACDGACSACNLPGRVGTCSAHARGTDPERNCVGMGGDPGCMATCDGFGECRFPTSEATCGSCGRCVVDVHLIITSTCRQPTTCAPDGGILPPPPVPRPDAGFPFPPGSGGAFGGSGGFAGTGGSRVPAGTGGSVVGGLGGRPGSGGAFGASGGFAFGGAPGIGGGFGGGGTSGIGGANGRGGAPGVGGASGLGGAGGTSAPPNQRADGSVAPDGAGSPPPSPVDASSSRPTARLANRGCGCRVGGADPVPGFGLAGGLSALGLMLLLKRRRSSGETA